VAEPGKAVMDAKVFDGLRSARRLVFGCEQLGGYNWGSVEITEIERAISVAVDAGVALFDTADCYGPFLSEERLGTVLRPVRKRVAIATKFGVRIDQQGRRTNDSSPQWCRKAAHDSLRRLGVDFIDLYQMHYRDGSTPLEDTIDELERLRTSGLIRQWGLCNVEPDEVPSDAWAFCASLQSELSLLAGDHELAARDACARGSRFLAYGVLAQGLLSGRYDAAAHFTPDDRRSHQRYRNFHGERFVAALEVLGELKACSSELGCQPSVLAIAWVRSLHPQIWPIVGIKSCSQLEDALSATDLDVSHSIVARLRAAAERFTEIQ